ncbi:PREDICTED: uncharacterized protein LOC109466211 [Branchiostoma belcheri]|uniref:Uncharacterized protein LOC109466211 n=1 Tax=Branchiostoma belcheri TaxID=7741 RepID=A0A6P4YL51_BRABE|nr:PREDICTED: uncharacterized protein LOC109466211 [Branchiostoma belcheri]
MAKIFFLLVTAVTVLPGLIDGRPTKYRSKLKRSDLGPDGYVVLTQRQVDAISPFLNLHPQGRDPNKRVNKRTDAPYRVFIDRNPHRIPMDIPFARCRKQACRPSLEQGYFYAPRWVIWKVMVDGELEYRGQVEQVPVACRCLRAKVADPYA